MWSWSTSGHLLFVWIWQWYQIRLPLTANPMLEIWGYLKKYLVSLSNVNKRKVTWCWSWSHINVKFLPAGVARAGLGIAFDRNGPLRFLRALQGSLGFFWVPLRGHSYILEKNRGPSINLKIGAIHYFFKNFVRGHLNICLGPFIKKLKN